MDELPALPAGLVAVTGDEGTGKTALLRRMAAEWPGTLWLDLSLPGRDDDTPLQVWASLRTQWPQWDTGLLEDLADALGLAEHAAKPLFMLSRGSRRKVALVALLASGARVTCIDQPFAALDAASCGTVREFLHEAAGHATRTWVVADYEADSGLPWARVISLD